jgi:riboflavin synthase
MAGYHWDVELHSRHSWVQVSWNNSRQCNNLSILCILLIDRVIKFEQDRRYLTDKVSALKKAKRYMITKLETLNKTIMDIEEEEEEEEEEVNTEACEID